MLTPRPPPLMVFNEPEASLHPDLLWPLTRLFLTVSERAQLFVVTHSRRLANELRRDPRCVDIALEKRLGETLAPDHDASKWVWPSR